MKKVATIVAAAAMTVAIAAPAARAAEATVGLDVASAYVFRGVTFNDGLVAQPYVEVAGLPVTFGVWANFDIDDYDGALDDGQFSEVDLYASYDLPLGEDSPVSASVGYTEYLYPQGTEADREIGLSVGLNAPLSPAIGVYYGLDGGIEESIYADFSVGQDVELSEDAVLSLGAVVGYVEPDVGESGFSHYEVSAGVAFGFISADITYIGEIDDDVLMTDTEVVGAIRTSFTF
jgi:uncharacterized protein (TIGR02001 family)